MIVVSMLVTSVSLATTWVVVNTYIQQVIRSMGVEGMMRPVSMSEMMASLFSDHNENQNTPAPEQTVETPIQSNEPPEGEPLENVLPVIGQLNPSVVSEVDDTEILFSADELNEKKTNLTAQDRMEIFTLLSKKVPPEEVEKLSILLESGITTEELRQVSHILRAYLSEAEYLQLIEMIK